MKHLSDQVRATRKPQSITKTPKTVINSPISTDPFLDLIRLLRPQAILWGVIRANGHWGVSFRKRDDLLFFRVESGNCFLIQSSAGPLPLEPGDFVLVQTATPFAVASDLDQPPIDSEALVAARRAPEIHVGEGHERPVTVRGGRFVLGTSNENLLMGLLPPLIHIRSKAPSSERVRALLAMNEVESLTPRPGSDFVIARLMEVLLVELLRDQAWVKEKPQPGMLRGLSDPVTARALSALHGNLAGSWTTAKLARLCGTSGSGFSIRFTKLVGLAPMSYLQQWRIAVAKDELHCGLRSIAEIASVVGFQSSSALSTAFTRMVGCSPKRFAELNTLTE